MKRVMPIHLESVSIMTGINQSINISREGIVMSDEKADELVRKNKTFLFAVKEVETDKVQPKNDEEIKKETKETKEKRVFIEVPEPKIKKETKKETKNKKKKNKKKKSAKDWFKVVEDDLKDIKPEEVADPIAEESKIDEELKDKID